LDEGKRLGSAPFVFITGENAFNACMVAMCVSEMFYVWWRENCQHPARV